ncbi:MAG: TonB family protein [Bdellovibrionaceae bacterium]|nr:TonB family protein [Pseudobdellovibrionaceae bacterium]
MRMELESNHLVEKASSREKFSFSLPKETSLNSNSFRVKSDTKPPEFIDSSDNIDERQLSFEDLFNNSSFNNNILAKIPTVEVLNNNIFISPPRFKRYLSGSILLHSLLVLFIVKAEMDLPQKDEKKELIPISVSFEGNSSSQISPTSLVDSSSKSEKHLPISTLEDSTNSVVDNPVVKNQLKQLSQPSKVAATTTNSKVAIKKVLPHKSPVSEFSINKATASQNNNVNLKAENLSLADIKDPELNPSIVDGTAPVASDVLLEDLNQDLDTLKNSDDSHINNTEKEFSDLSESNLKDISDKSSALTEDLSNLDSKANERIQNLKNEKASLAQARQNELVRQAQISIQKQKSTSRSGSEITNGNGSGEKGTGSGSQGQEQIRKLEDLRQAPGNIKPQYSDEERLQEISGTVVFNGFVSKEGRLTEFKLVKSSGHRSLDAKTLQALKKWKFYPGQEGWVELPFIWDLKGEVSQKPTLLKRK